MKKSVFAVNGMKCVHCKVNVENALKAVTGVRAAEASLDDANVTVEYDENAVPLNGSKKPLRTVDVMK